MNTRRAAFAIAVLMTFAAACSGGGETAAFDQVSDQAIWMVP